MANSRHQNCGDTEKHVTTTDMSNTIESDIDIDFLGVLTLTIDIELVISE